MVDSPTFDLRRGDLVGRYLILGMIRVEALGAVHAAYDPELDRKVALRQLLAGRLRDAQAMARLHHPNVVPVHDVVEHEGGVFVAMEFIEGRKAAAWLAEEGPGWRSVLSVFVEAGRGLAAAHEVGLVHGDFRADAVLLDADARARVTDLRLAAPLGEAAAQDQSSFRTALGEALQGTDVPAWLRRICEGGAAPETGRGFASMAVLITALERGQSGARKRKALAGLGALAVTAAGAEGFRRLDEARARAQCEEEGAAIEVVWSERRREQLSTALLGTNVTYAATTAEKVMPWLDAHAGAWTDATNTACLNTTVDHTWDADTLERSRWCLVERRMELDALLEQLESGKNDAVRGAVRAAAELGVLDRCIDPDALARAPTPPTEQRPALQEVRAVLSRARALMKTNAKQEALQTARAALRDAEALGWRPLVASCRFLVGGLLERTGAYAESEAALEAAYFDATAGNNREVAFSAAQLLVYVVGLRQRRHDAGMLWSRVAGLQLAALPDPAGLRLVESLEHKAYIQTGRGSNDEALALRERAVGLVEAALHPEHPKVGRSLAELAAVQTARGAFPEAKALLERALELQTNALGPEHPDLATTLNKLAAVKWQQGDFPAAQGYFERALAIWERALGPDHPHVGAVLQNLGTGHWSQGRYAKARALFERAIPILEKRLGAEHPHVAEALRNLAGTMRAMGDLEQARALTERALAIQEKALGARHPEVAMSLVGLAIFLAQDGEHAGAEALFDRALAITEEVQGPDHPDTAYCLKEMATLYGKMGAYERAIAASKRSLQIQVKAVGAEHPSVGEIVINQARLYGSAGRHAEARELFERGVRILEQALGPEHPHVAQALAHFAEYRVESRAWPEAVRLAELAVAGSVAAKVNAISVARRRFVLARALWGAGDQRPRALKLARQASAALTDANDQDNLAAVEAWLAARKPR